LFIAIMVKIKPLPNQDVQGILQSESACWSAMLHSVMCFIKFSTCQHVEKHLGIQMK